MPSLFDMISSAIRPIISWLKGQPICSIVRPSDRPLVRKFIEAAKEGTPVSYSEKRTGGYGYAEFQVLKVGLHSRSSCADLWWI